MDRYIMICQSFGKVDDLRVTDELHHFHNQGDFLGLPLGYPRLFFKENVDIHTPNRFKMS